MNISNLKANVTLAPSVSFGKISWGSEKDRETTQDSFVSLIRANEEYGYKAVTFSDIQAQLGIIQKMPQNVIINANNDTYSGEMYLYAKNEDGKILTSYCSDPEYNMDINKFADNVKANLEEKDESQLKEEARFKAVQNAMEELAS